MLAIAQANPTRGGAALPAPVFLVSADEDTVKSV